MHGALLTEPPHGGAHHLAISGMPCTPTRCGRAECRVGDRGVMDRRGRAGSARRPVLPLFWLDAAVAGLATIGAAVVLGTAPASAATAYTDAVGAARTAWGSRRSRSRAIQVPAIQVPAIQVPRARRCGRPMPGPNRPARRRPRWCRTSTRPHRSGVVGGRPRGALHPGTFWWWGPGTGPQLIWARRKIRPRSRPSPGGGSRTNPSYTRPNRDWRDLDVDHRSRSRLEFRVHATPERLTHARRRKGPNYPLS